MFGLARYNRKQMFVLMCNLHGLITAPITGSETFDCIERHKDAGCTHQVSILRSGITAKVHGQVQHGHVHQLEVANSLMREALHLIATGKREDGTYNRDRKACELLARETLEKVKHV